MGNELSGKVAIVTGGASGIGRASVERFLEEGAQVVIADINRELGSTVAAALGSGVEFKQTDVSASGEVADLVAFTVARFGGLHIMFNNAGIPTAMRANFLDDELADFHRIMEVDLLGVMLGTQHAARHMAENGGGSIINTTSIGGIRAGTGELSYRAAKAGVIHFTKCAAIDLAHHGIRVNSIAPGAIVTSIVSTATAHLPDSAEATRRLREAMKSIRPLQQDGTATDIANAAVYYASDRSSYVTGTVLPVDGGIVAGHAMNTMAEIEKDQLAS
ncbi:NAD(P)-dependent dehydrogenase (short-subunit alcohol dehydrogenase family) [Kibdelosporangium banguiense]|uniref:NAD(P)-dependent dehydrogenase (Short-subunit alcohol dehydrogenase family) n=1 Tax=Kibdelosporangium banguiense TaxID=1365924 RepID=A0ABS4U2P7_9PSEU|nr:SDR family oxidoreductase [Kibdelosporangium banguiense]MBP2330489.1 NAD(P)-dependent dehydrogenase (short-subunit alcohol dehydrogenase family) [Kibdelosporangium banguiense]